MSSSSAQTPSGLSADKLLLSQAAGNAQAWLAALFVSLALFPCPGSTAIVEGRDETPANEALPSMASVDDDGNPVYENTAAGKMLCAGDILDAKKTLSENRRTTLDLLKHIHSTCSSSSLLSAGDDAAYKLRRNDAATLVSVLVRLNSPTERADLIQAIKEMINTRETPLSKDDANSCEVLARKIHQQAEYLERTFGANISVYAFAAAALNGGLDPSLHKHFLVQEGQRETGWTKDQSREDAVKAYNALVARVVKEGKSSSLHSADSAQSALSLAALGRPGASGVPKPHDQEGDCPTCLAAKKSEPRLTIQGGLNHKPGSQDCPMQRKLFGTIKRQLDSDRRPKTGDRDEKRPWPKVPKAPDVPRGASSKAPAAPRAASSVIADGETMDVFVQRRLLEMEYQNQGGSQSRYNAHAAVSSPPPSSEDERRVLELEETLLGFRGAIGTRRSLALSATARTPDELAALLDAVLLDSARYEYGSNDDGPGAYDLDYDDDDHDPTVEDRMATIAALQAEYVALSTAANPMKAATPALDTPVVSALAPPPPGAAPSQATGLTALAVAALAALLPPLWWGSMSVWSVVSSVLATSCSWTTSALVSALSVAQRFAFQSAFVFLLLGLFGPLLTGTAASATHAGGPVAFPATSGVRSALGSPTLSDCWLADNACSSSQTNRLDFFPHGVVELPTPILISVASATSPPMYATHAGFSNCLAPFNKCFYVPDASVNLFSLGSLQRQGGSYATVGTDNLIVRDTSGRIIADLALDSNNTYPFTVGAAMSSASESPVVASAAAAVRVDGAH